MMRYMRKDTETTAVVFRKYRGTGDILALFPLIEFAPGQCGSYQFIGQHGGADYMGCMAITVPATPAEYRSLKREIERIGYALKIYARKPPA